MFHQMLDRAEAGDQVGALIRGIKRDDVRRGQIVAKPGTISMHNHFAAQVVPIATFSAFYLSCIIYNRQRLTVWKIARKIIRTVLCHVVYDSCALTCTCI